MRMIRLRSCGMQDGRRGGDSCLSRVSNLPSTTLRLRYRTKSFFFCGLAQTYGILFAFMVEVVSRCERSASVCEVFGARVPSVKKGGYLIREGRLAGLGPGWRGAMLPSLMVDSDCLWFRALYPGNFYSLELGSILHSAYKIAHKSQGFQS